MFCLCGLKGKSFFYHMLDEAAKKVAERNAINWWMKNLKHSVIPSRIPYTFYIACRVDDCDTTPRFWRDGLWYCAYHLPEDGHPMSEEHIACATQSYQDQQLNEHLQNAQEVSDRAQEEEENRNHPMNRQDALNQALAQWADYWRLENDKPIEESFGSEPDCFRRCKAASIDP